MTYKKIVKVNVNVIVEKNGFLGLEQTEVFALDEIKFLKGIMVLGISLSGKAAIKRGQTRTRSQFAEREQVRRSQSCFHKED